MSSGRERENEKVKGGRKFTARVRPRSGKWAHHHESLQPREDLGVVRVLEERPDLRYGRRLLPHTRVQRYRLALILDAPQDVHLGQDTN